MPQLYENLKGVRAEFHLVNGDQVSGIVEEVDEEFVELKDVGGSEQFWIVTSTIVSVSKPSSN